MALAKDELNETVRTIRSAQLKVAPFLTIVSLIADATKEIVMEIINCGVDTVILKPFSRSQFLDHLWHDIEHRRSFVVTTDYT